MACTITSVQRITKEMEEVSNGEEQIIKSSDNLMSIVDKLDKAMAEFKIYFEY